MVWVSPFLGVLLFLSGPPQAGQLSGTISSAGQPIPGAVVTATQGDRKISISTDESGKYLLEGLAPGAWTVEVEIFDFSKARREVTIGESPVMADWSLELKPKPQAAARPPGSPGSPIRGPGPTSRQQNGFRAAALNQVAENQVLDALTPQPGANGAQTSADSNEAFLVSGSLSRGLAAPQEEDPFAMRRAGGFGQGPGGPGGPGAPNVPGFGGGAGGGPGGAPRFGGMGPGMGPGELGGPGGRGGFGGGRAGMGRPPGDWTNFGNRANRNRDALRGAAFFSLRNSALDARPYSLTGQTVPKPSYAQSRFGLVGGGALRIPKIVHSEKTFFFASYFGTRSRNPYNYNATATLPTPAERSGDFSRSFTPAGLAQVFDPTTRKPFLDNRVPLSRMNPAALGLLDFIPLPNQPGSVQNYQYLTSIPQDTDNFGLRLTHTLSERDSFGFDLNLQQRNAKNAQLYGFKDDTDGRGLNTSLSWTHNFGPKLIHRLSWNFSRNRSNTAPFFAFGANVAEALGIQGTSQDPINFGP
ncbi:MAG: carboxypeptidase regulatory-like domain-containing protein, partial [Acidobacteria bacterium]|nr:carboxypeptidase regulatory-like domain-containing protein [Acidobacteriota bacterium]